MSRQQAIVGSINRALDSLVTTANAVPADKLNWKPSETARSIHDILVECTMTPHFNKLILDKASQGVIEIALPNPEDLGVIQKEASLALPTVDLLTKALRDNHKMLTDHILTTSDELLNKEIVLLIGDGMKMTVADSLFWCGTHLQYHYGQVNYIQTIYGDGVNR